MLNNKRKCVIHEINIIKHTFRGSSILNEKPAVLRNVTAAELLTIVANLEKGKLLPNHSKLFLGSKTFSFHLSVLSVTNTF